MGPQLAHDINSLWRFFRLGEKCKRFVKRNNVRVACPARTFLDGAELTIVNDEGAKSSDAGGNWFSGRGVPPEFAGERKVADSVRERDCRRINAGRYACAF